MHASDRSSDGTAGQICQCPNWTCRAIPLPGRGLALSVRSRAAGAEWRAEPITAHVPSGCPPPEPLCCKTYSTFGPRNVDPVVAAPRISRQRRHAAQLSLFFAHCSCRCYSYLDRISSMVAAPLGSVVRREGVCMPSPGNQSPGRLHNAELCLQVRSAPGIAIGALDIAMGLCRHTHAH